MEALMSSGVDDREPHKLVHDGAVDAMDGAVLPKNSIPALLIVSYHLRGEE